MLVPPPALTPDEQAFLDGPVETLCGMLDDWEMHERNDLPPEVWTYIKAQRFLGMIIPKEYGGLDFSAAAQSAVIVKICSRSLTAGVTVMVPNSLGPASCSCTTGPTSRSSHYLPRLAAARRSRASRSRAPGRIRRRRHARSRHRLLTGCTTGAKCSACASRGTSATSRSRPSRRSSASRSRPTIPTICSAANASSASRCALIPTDTPGVEIGERHRPVGSAFQNGPTHGRDVFVPMDWVIGGQRHDRPRLAHARRVPGRRPRDLAAGAQRRVGEARGAHDRRLRAPAPPVPPADRRVRGRRRGAGADRRHHLSHRRRAPPDGERARPRREALGAVGDPEVSRHREHAQVVNDALDIHGGRGVCDGPSNYLAGVYKSGPSRSRWKARTSSRAA